MNHEVVSVKAIKISKICAVCNHESLQWANIYPDETSDKDISENNNKSSGEEDFTS